MEWLLWFKDMRIPARTRSQVGSLIRPELTALGLDPIGAPSTLFPAEQTFGQWIVRVRTPRRTEQSHVAAVADRAGRHVGLSLQRLPQSVPPVSPSGKEK
jgi:hypothetical protein